MKVNSVELVLLALSQAGSTLASGKAHEQAFLGPSEGVKDMPLLGYGTWNLDREKGPQAVSKAIQVGYRHIDAAKIYANEKQTGEGIAAGLKAAGLSRSDLWVTSKLWNDAHAPDAVPAALNQTLSDLQLDYLDLYLMHWPVAKGSDGSNAIDYLETWHAMEALLETGRVRHIGVSNFDADQLRDILAHSKTLPYAHQFELHPYLPQTDFVAAHKKHGVRVTAYSPLGNTNPTYTASRKGHAAQAVPPLLENPVLKRIAKHRGCTPAQAALAWGMARGTAVIPKATSAEHIEEDFDAYKCDLKEKDFKALASLPVKRFNNPSGSWGVELFRGLQDAQAQHLGHAWSQLKMVWYKAEGLGRSVVAKVVGEL